MLRNLNYNGIIGVNLGKNMTSPSALEDYTKGIKKFGDVADYFVINISWYVIVVNCLLELLTIFIVFL